MLSILNKKVNVLFLMLSFFYMVFAIFVVGVVTTYFVQNEAAKVESALRNNLALVRSNFEASIYMDTYLADSLATVVTIDPNLATNNWPTVAGKLYRKSKFVRNVALAPNDIISHVYPLKGNEKAIGLDYRTVPAQYKSILTAKKMQKVYISGPVDLVQGGKGLIARFPIFSDYPENEVYWGSVSVVMDYNKLIDSAGLVGFEGAEIAIRKLVTGSGPDRVFYGDSRLFERQDVLHQIHLPSVSWQLAASLNTKDVEQLRYVRKIVALIGILTAFLVYSLVFLLYRNFIIAHKASLHDELTNLPNRRFLIAMLKRQMTKDAAKSSFALLNIDLNRFKQVNDSHGHEAGDVLLKHIAALLQHSVRTSDVVARFGGDEFTVLLYRVSDADKVSKIIAKIRGQIEASPIIFDGHEIKPSLSIGYTIYDGQETTITELLSEADKSMYANKNALKLKLASKAV